LFSIDFFSLLGSTEVTELQLTSQHNIILSHSHSVSPTYYIA